MNDLTPTDTPNLATERTPVGNLTDFVDGVDKDNPLDLEITVDANTNNVVIFYNKPFTTDISWFEYNLKTSKLDFIMDGGEIRDVGMPLNASIARYMQNAHQILTVEMNDETGQANKGAYIPVILQQD